MARTRGKRFWKVSKPRLKVSSVSTDGPGYEEAEMLASEDLVWMHYEGTRVVATNYYETEYADLGFVVLGCFSDTFHLLLPPPIMPHLEDMRAAEYAIVTRGRLPRQRQRGPDGIVRRRDARGGIEVLFEDHTAAPCQLLMDEHMATDLPSSGALGRTDFGLVVYSEGVRVALELPARYRRAPRLPWRRSWKDR